MANLKKIDIVNRKDMTPRHRWTVETQAPNGDWSVSLGTGSWQTAVDFARYHRDDRGATVRIVDETNES